MPPKGRMVPKLVLIPKAHIEALQLLVDAKVYPSQTEAIRQAIRDLLNSEMDI